MTRGCLIGLSRRRFARAYLRLTLRQHTGHEPLTLTESLDFKRDGIDA